MSPQPITDNTLFYGDNLNILREYVPDASIDLIYIEPPTADMTAAALKAGFYHSPAWGKNFPRIQILTIADLLRGTEVQMPPQYGTFKQAQKVLSVPEQQAALDWE